MSVYIDKERFCEECKLWYDEQFFHKKCPSCERKKFEIKRLKGKESIMSKITKYFNLRRKDNGTNKIKNN